MTGAGLRLLIADDQSLLNEALADFLSRSADFQSVSCVASLGEVYDQLAEGRQFDIIILDLNMPGMQGVESAGRLAHDHPGVQVAILSASVDQVLKAAMTEGVRGFIPKTISGQALISVIRLIACGVAYFPAEQLLKIAQGRLEDPHGPSLTAEEAAALDRLRQGATNKEIARDLQLSDARVKSLIRSLGAKLNARNRTDIVVKAAQLEA